MLNLKKIGITLVELSTLTNISRPTLYKYIELFVEGNGIYIRHDLYLLFEYIKNNQDAKKKDVYVYYDKLSKKE